MCWLWILMSLYLPGGLRSNTTEAPKEPCTVGAIRWDGWFAGNTYERFLAPAQWRDRLPFYARELPGQGVEVRADGKGVMEREIAFARRGGLDYWAFCYYHPRSWEGADAFNGALRRYLASPNRRDLRFCLLLQGPWLGPKEDWRSTVASFVAMFREPAYQRVAGGRPLVYLYTVEGLAGHFGSEAEARRALEELRAESRRAGAGDPYLVAQVYSADMGARAVDQFGFDAIGAYTAHGYGRPHQEHPYADLASDNRAFWESCRATGKPVVPLVNAGWDGRPRLVDEKLATYYRGPWYRMPTPEELAAHVQSARKWVRMYPKTATATTVLIYAWNETDEGGWLVPTPKEGATRLDALRKTRKE